MDSIFQLGNTCQGIESDKINERKKSAENLRNLLSNVSIMKQLHANSIKNNRNSIRWVDVFRSVCRYMLKEGDHLCQLREKSFASKSKSPRNINITTSLSLTRFVIQSANKNGVIRLKCHEIVQHIFGVLNNDSYLELFGSNYSHLLLSEILKVKTMWCHLSLPACQELLQLFCHLFDDPPKSNEWNNVVTVQIIEKLIYILCRQFNTNLKSLYGFYCHVFNESLREKSDMIVKSLLSSCITFLSVMAPTYRILTCKLGEDVILNLLFLWKNSTKDHTKILIVKFLKYQLIAHHPLGRKSESNGAYACDWGVWKMHLNSINEVLHKDLFERRIVSKNTDLNNQMISLFADVCNILFEEQKFIEMPLTLTHTSSPISKRRKIETGIGPICESIKELSSSPEVITRLHFLSALASRYPQEIKHEDYLILLQTAYFMQIDCNKLEILSSNLKFLKDLATAFRYNLDKFDTEERAIVMDLWLKIQDLATRSLSLGNCKGECHSLIQEMILQQLFSTQHDLLPLFISPSLHIPSKEAILTLHLLCVKDHILLENIPESAITFETLGLGSKYLIRVAFIQWLLPHQSSLSSSSVSLTQKLSSTSRQNGTFFQNNIPERSELLACLCLKDLSKLSVNVDSEVANNFDYLMNELQKFYLQATFDLDELFTDPLLTCEEQVMDGEFVVLEPIKEVLIDFVKKELDAMARIYLEDEDKKPRILSCQYLFLLCLVRSLLKFQVISESELNNSQFFHLCKNAMSQLNEILEDLLKSDFSIKLNLENLIFVLDKLAEVSNLDCGLNKDLGKIFNVFLHSIIPSTLVDSIFKIFKEKNKKNYFADNSQKSHSGRNDDSSDDSDFDVFKTPKSSCSTNEEDSTSSLIFDSDSEIEDNDDSMALDEYILGADFKLNSSSFSPSSMEYAKYLCAKFLSKLCIHDERNHPGTSKIFNKIIDIINGKFMVSSYKDLKIILTFLFELTSGGLALDQSQVKEILEILRIINKTYDKDKEILILCINILSRLASFLKGIKNDSNQLKINRDRFEWLFNRFEYKMLNSESSLAMNKALLNCFIQIMKNNSVDWIPFNCHDEEKLSISAYKTFLTSKNLCVKVEAAKSSWLLFYVLSHNDKFETRSLEYKENVLELVTNFFDEHIKMKEKSRSEEEANDIILGKLSSMLTCFVTLLTSSPCFVPKILLSMCEIINEYDIQQFSTVSKVLSKTLGIVGYETTSALIEDHLSYIIYYWIEGRSISKFPFQLLHVNSLKSFYSSYSSIIIPELIFNADFESIKEIGNLLDITPKRLIIPSIPIVVARLMPKYTMQNSNDELSSHWIVQYKNKAALCENFIAQQISKKVVNEIVKSRFKKISFHIFNSVYTKDSPQSNFKGLPFHFAEDTVKQALFYLAKIHFDGKSFISTLLKSNSAFFNMMHELSNQVYSRRQSLRKRNAMLAYKLFMKEVADNLSQNEFSSCKSYIIRDSFYTNINILLLRNQDLEVSLYALEIIDFMTRAVVKHHNQELDHLSTIVDCLVSISANESLHVEVMKILSFLIIDCEEELKQHISNLDPFPDTEAFNCIESIRIRTKYRNGAFTLSEEFQHFLSCKKNSFPSHNVASLRHLLLQIKEKKDELKMIIESFQSIKMFSEQVDDSLLHQVICQLINLSAQKSDEQVSIEACRCLGEIGPVDLSCCILKPSVAYQVSNFDPNTDAMVVILKELSSYLIDKDVKVKSSAIKVLEDVMSLAYVNNLITKSECFDDCEFVKYILPLKSSKKRTTPEIEMCEDFSAISDPDNWIPKHGRHSDWIKNLVCCLINSLNFEENFLKCLLPIAAEKVEFCEIILPFIVHKLLLQDDKNLKKLLSENIKNFFQKHCELNEATVNTQSIVRNKRSLRTMINIVQYLRTRKKDQMPHNHGTYNFWLDINYLDIAEAARFCSSYFAVILFTEIWIQDYSVKNVDCSDSHSQGLIGSLTAGCLPANKAHRIQNLMSEALVAIGDHDSVYGCNFAQELELSDRMNRYDLENHWEKLISAYDLHLSVAANVPEQLKFLKTLQKSGLSHLQESYLKGIETNNSKEWKQFQYECAWRNGNWGSLNVANGGDELEYHKLIYDSLCCLHEQDSRGLEKSIQFARLSLKDSLKVCNIEATKNVYTELTKLQCVTIIEDVVKFLENPTTNELIDKWTFNDDLHGNEFEFVEPIISLQISLMKLIQLQNPCNFLILSTLQERLQASSKLARKAGNFQLAEKCLFGMKKMVSDGVKLWQLKLEEAKLLWAKSERNLAKQNLKSLLNHLGKNNNLETDFGAFHPLALTVQGKWLAETSSESPSIIIEEYLEKAIKLMEERNLNPKVLAETHLALARYADSQYKNIVNYFKSPTYQSKCELINRSKLAAESLRAISDSSKTTSEKEALRMHQNHTIIDETEINAMRIDRNGFLVKSLKSYIRCLQHTGDYILPMFRMISLWFQNSTDDTVILLIQKNYLKIQSYKYLPLMYQLVARISLDNSKGDKFQETLQNIIVKTSVDHPFHTLLIILGLANASKDLMYDHDLKQLSERSSHKTGGDSRLKAAKIILDEVSIKHKKLISNLSKMCDAYISLAYLQNSPNKKSNVLKIPRNESILKLKDVENVPIPTVDIAVQKSGIYDDIPMIKEIQPQYHFVGGINAPKKIHCLGTDGRTYIQLIKGKDDLRQDAVMQQFFTLVNDLLLQDAETRKRKLRMRTYKVIPLSQRSGVVQWCDGTQPFGDYLLGKNGAHKFYRPHDLSDRDCFFEMKKCDAKGNKEKRETFNQICQKFRPVFRNFFLEKFLEPAIWYERRLTYTQSVATCSIVGYILGLGDRHTQNILIDKQTAEFIHIDLGIAFEQGKLLRTPETVPFRLTRDVIDGMGSMGIEGVFRRCCEITMKVMHRSQEVLVTIPEVLLYDPLYKWTVSQEKVAKIRGGNSEIEYNSKTQSISGSVDNSAMDDIPIEPEVNKIAERVLLRLKEKLQGIERGVAMSISGQINFLIQEATDPNNLSKLYCGWKPFV